MSEISKINLGIPNVAPKSEPAKMDAAPKADGAPVAGSTAQVDPNAIMSAMNAQAMANAAHFNLNGVDPKKYLSPEQIEGIQGSMADFENGVEKHEIALNEEFGHLSEYSSLSDQDKLAMAAQSFTQSE